jgi:hypothetical protein
MYYHHLSNFIVLLAILPSVVKLTLISTDILILPSNAQRGYVLLEETRPSRSREFAQCLQQAPSIHLAVDEKYGDLILNQSLKNVPLTLVPQPLCTIQRNQVSGVAAPFAFCACVI